MTKKQATEYARLFKKSAGVKELGNETNEEGEGKDRGRKNKIEEILSS